MSTELTDKTLIKLPATLYLSVIGSIIASTIWITTLFNNLNVKLDKMDNRLMVVEKQSWTVENQANWYASPRNLTNYYELSFKDRKDLIYSVRNVNSN